MTPTSDQTRHRLVLQVGKDASQAEIKAAYRRLVKQHHPDAGGDPEFFRAITAAYEALTTSKPKAQPSPARPKAYNPPKCPLCGMPLTGARVLNGCPATAKPQTAPFKAPIPKQSPAVTGFAWFATLCILGWLGCVVGGAFDNSRGGVGPMPPVKSSPVDQAYMNGSIDRTKAASADLSQRETRLVAYMTRPEIAVRFGNGDGLAAARKTLHDCLWSPENTSMVCLSWRHDAEDGYIPDCGCDHGSWCDLDDGTISGREKCRACLSTIPAWRATAGVPAATRKSFDNAVDLEQVWPSLNPTLFALPRWKQDEGSAPCGD